MEAGVLQNVLRKHYKYKQLDIKKNYIVKNLNALTERTKKIEKKRKKNKIIIMTIRKHFKEHEDVWERIDVLYLIL